MKNKEHQYKQIKINRYKVLFTFFNCTSSFLVTKLHLGRSYKTHYLRNLPVGFIKKFDTILSIYLLVSSFAVTTRKPLSPIHCYT